MAHSRRGPGRGKFVKYALHLEALGLVVHPANIPLGHTVESAAGKYLESSGGTQERHDIAKVLLDFLSLEREG